MIFAVTVQVGVHIADVTHFLKAGTAMDIEAALRATSVYLVQRRIDMLPKPLTEDICSLRGEVERLAFSVIWEMTPNAEVVSTRYHKSLIKSRAAMTYAEAQTRIDDERLNDELTVSTGPCDDTDLIVVGLQGQRTLFYLSVDIS